MKKFFELFCTVITIVIIGVVTWQIFSTSPIPEKEVTQPSSIPENVSPVACTMDAKQCSDGSYIGRVAPDCEFAACSSEPVNTVDSFEGCVEAGNPVMESYPRQCNHNGQHFVEEIEEQISEFPVRYGENAAKIEEYRSDCEQRMGVFNECGSACDPEAEVCIDVCSMICEGPDDEHMLPAPSSEIVCSPESKLTQMCTMEYAPVCGKVEVLCVTEPCEPVQQTFGNACGACASENVVSYTEGECLESN